MMGKEVHHIAVGGMVTNCWIYEDVVIAPGEESSRIIAYLEQHKLSPRYIVLSHGHFDHISAVPALSSWYGPSAEIAIHTADAEYLGKDSYPVHCNSFSAVTGNSAYLDSLWEDMPQPNRLLDEGDRIGPFTVLHLPGHTPGSIGLLDAEAGVLFSGDTLFSGGFGRTDLPGGNETQLSASLKRLFALDSNIQVFPGHGPSTTIRRESRGMG
jgi:glyoxylase-like metal-dependent hydrolase (beta-lactamase superfamily II)